MNFVDDVDFEFRCRRRVFDRVAQFPDFFDAAVAGAVNFQHVERAAVGNLPATGVIVIEICLRAAFAIEALGEDAGDGGFAGAARATEEVGVGDAVLPNGIGQRLGDMLLADDVAEALRPVLTRYDLIRHVKA